MARKPTGTSAPTELIEVAPEYTRTTEQAQDALALQEQQAQAHVRAVAAQIGYQLPGDATDPDLIQRDIAANMRRSVEACLEVGRGLMALKAACIHGEFGKRLDVLGLDNHVAARFMQAASKFSNLPTSATLKAIGNQSKLFEMLVLDDEQIEELALTGQTGELHLDDVATMSVKELRAALRQERQDNKYQAEQTEKERLRAEKAEKQLRKGGPQVQPYSERLAEFRTGVGELQDVAGKSLVQMAKQIDALAQWWQQEVLAAPDYDPQAPVRMPPELLDTARALAEHIELLAGGVGALQHKVAQAFGAELEMQPQYLMRDPMGGQMGDAEQDGDGVDEGEAAYADAGA